MLSHTAAKGLLDLADIFISGRQAFQAYRSMQGGIKPGVLLAYLEEVLARWQARRASGGLVLQMAGGRRPAGGQQPPAGRSGGSSGGGSATPEGGSSPRTEIDPKRTGHIFRNEPGHLPDTPANRKRLEDVANKPGTKLGSDKHGNEWYAETQPDGSQVWVQTRNGKITNGGVNNPPKPYNSDTGLSAPQAPGQPKK